jgi:hypothetical protein
MRPRIPEKNKKAGVCYAVTDDGLELPVVDVANPAFEIRLDDRELEALVQQFLRETKNQAKTPAFIQNLMLGIMQRRSVIMRGLMGASGTFLSGMNTYVMKLGPDNLNKSYFSGIDRRIVASPNVLFMRLRSQDMAHLLAGALIPPLEARRGPALRMLNIGGGPAIDSMNALIVIRQKQADLLKGREIYIHSLDLDASGPHFGARALASLLTEGAPLHGLQISFQHTPYEWSNPAQLRSLVEAFGDGRNIVAASSEGALFEYGSDEVIAGNLEALNAVTPADAVVVGSVTRADELGLAVNGASRGARAALQFRGLEAFTALARRAGWKLSKVIDRPLSHDILLEKA